MRLADYQKTYHDYSAKASDVARQLAFAGIGLVWVFKTQEGAKTGIPSGLLLPLALFALALAFDLLQYIAATVVWGTLQWLRERELYNELDSSGIFRKRKEMDHPSSIKLPQIAFFGLKMASVFIGYMSLSVFIWTEWYDLTGITLWLQRLFDGVGR